MEQSNPQIEASLDALATICCAAIDGSENPAELERVDGLLKTLLMSGYARLDQRSLQVDLESRIKEKCTSVSHRVGDLASLSARIASQFADLARQQSRTPDDLSRAANSSPATNA
jgi:hypothetical protein